MTYTIDGCDAAVLGYVDDSGTFRVVYDHSRLITVFMNAGMEREEALEWIDFNIQGAYIGEGQPLILYPATREEIDVLVDSCD